MSGFELAHLEARSLQLCDGEVTVSLRQWGKESSPAIVYLHGLTPWAELELNEAAPVWAARGFRVLAPVVPGLFDGEPLPPEAYTPTNMAALTLRVLDDLELPQVAIVGYSWGGEIAVRFAAAAPERTAGLVLLDSGYSDGEPPAEETFAAFAGNLQAQQARLRFPDWDTFLVAMEGRAQQWRPALAERLRAGMRADEGAIVARARAEVAAAALWGLRDEGASDAWPALAVLDAPILLLVASASVATDEDRASLAEFQRVVPQADVREVQGGHDLLADAPDEVAAVAEWLQRE